MPDRAWIDGVQALRSAQDHLDAGLPFHAHEVLEQRWRCAPTEERGVWRALAQWAAALTHAARGNDVGARAVAARALPMLTESAGTVEYLDVTAVLRSCRRMAACGATGYPDAGVRLLRPDPESTTESGAADTDDTR